MEPQNPNVDTSRPFRSVKEAVAIFGEQRLLVGFKAFNSPPPLPPPSLGLNKPQIKNIVECEVATKVFTTIDELHEEDKVVEELSDKGRRNDHGLISADLKKLEVELAETKKELRLLKKRESETEVAVAALNAELHKSMSRLAMAEASVAAKAATPTRSLPGGFGMRSREDDVSMDINKDTAIVRAAAEDQVNYYPTLSEILSIGEMSKKKKMMKKQKPIVPLVGDLVSSSISSWKRRASNNSTLY